MTSEEAERKTQEEEEELYELYWAQNTSAHGISRVIATTRAQRAVWIIALLACFVYVTYEIYQSVHTYQQYLTTTEISKYNKEKIDFPSVTFCNFNRWRKSKLTDEALANLKKVLSVYSYDYVIPELSDSDRGQVQVADLAALIDPPTTTEKPKTTTTTARPLAFCVLPETNNGLSYELRGDYHNAERTSCVEGSIINFYCDGADVKAMDGELEQTCTENGTFSGRIPLCVNNAQSGDVYAVANNDSSSTAMAVSDIINYANSSLESDGLTLCLWIKTMKKHKLGTVLSYGQGEETILSVQQIEQTNSDFIYGIKYTIFGSEGGTMALLRFNRWYPMCLQYSTSGAHSQLHSLKLYKQLLGDEEGLQVYGDDDISNIRDFSFNGQVVYFNEYASYLNFQDGARPTFDSSGAEIANVNIWDRVLSVDVMNKMLWSGNVYSMGKHNTRIVAGSISDQMIPYTSNVPDSVRVKRQVNQEATSSTTASASSSSTTEPSSNNSTDSTSNEEKDMFNFAAFTRVAGWQMVDEHSNHSSDEPNTLLSCTFRGKACDSRWFTHKFGAYGNCYTFNQKLPEFLAEEENIHTPLFQDNAGPIGGLKIMLDIQTWEYAESIDLHGSSELGLKFIVHTPYQTPIINAMGYSAGPGQKAFVGFQKNRVTNLYPPWGKCDPDKELTYVDHYTVEACAIECKLKKVVAECGCKPYYFPGDFDSCSFDVLSSCAFIEIAKINANFGESCDCPIACNDEEFDVKLSYSGFPNIPFGTDLGKKLKIKLPEAVPGGPEYGTQVQYIKGNVVSLDLYFESMSEMETIQNKAMDSTALLGSIGGHLGLFIGCSVLTAFEFLECIIMSTIGHCRKIKERRLQRRKQKQAALEEAVHGYHNSSINKGEMNEC